MGGSVEISQQQENKELGTQVPKELDNKLNQADGKTIAANLIKTVDKLPPTDEKTDTKEQIISVTEIKEKVKEPTPYEQLEKSIIAGKTEIPYSYEAFKENVAKGLSKGAVKDFDPLIKFLSNEVKIQSCQEGLKAGETGNYLSEFKARLEQSQKDDNKALYKEFLKLRAIQDKNEQSKLDPTLIAGGGTLKLADLNTEESGMIMTINNRKKNTLPNITIAGNLLKDPTFLSSQANFRNLIKAGFYQTRPDKEKARQKYFLKDLNNENKTINPRDLIPSGYNKVSQGTEAIQFIQQLCGKNLSEQGRKNLIINGSTTAFSFENIDNTREKPVADKYLPILKAAYPGADVDYKDKTITVTYSMKSMFDYVTQGQNTANMNTISSKLNITNGSNVYTNLTNKANNATKDIIANAEILTIPNKYNTDVNVVNATKRVMTKVKGFNEFMVNKMYGSNANLDAITNIDLNPRESRKEILGLNDIKDYRTFITALDTYLNQPGTILTDQVDSNVGGNIDVKYGRILMVKQNDFTKNRELVSYNVNDDVNHTTAKAASPASRGLPTP